jgi:MFS family permease
VALMKDLSQVLHSRMLLKPDMLTKHFHAGTFNQTNFQKLLGIDKLDDEAFADVKGNVSAMVQIGSVAGAGLAFLLADRIGRLWATRQLCALWILGIVIFLTNGGRLGQVYAGRFIAGMGIGQTTVV